MEKSKHREFRDLDLEIKGIARTYLNFLISKRKDSKALRVSDSQTDEQLNRDRYIQAVNEALNSLDGLEKHLLKMEFIEFKDYRNWWVGSISKSQYYRLKRTGMVNFLSSFLKVYYNNTESVGEEND